MTGYGIKTFALRIRQKTGCDITDITGELNRNIESLPFETGTISLFVVGSTGSLTTIEYEPGVVEDLKAAVTALAPPDKVYAHEKAWHDGNGHSHVQAALIGPSLILPVRSSRMALGTWQQVVVINHDNKPRERRIEATLMGI